MAKTIQTRTGNVASPSGTPSELANCASAGCDLAQVTSSQPQSVVTLEDEPRDTVSASYVRFDTLRQQFGLFGAATARDAHLVDTQVPNVVCTDGFLRGA